MRFINYTIPSNAYSAHVWAQLAAYNRMLIAHPSVFLLINDCFTYYWYLIAYYIYYYYIITIRGYNYVLYYIYNALVYRSEYDVRTREIAIIILRISIVYTYNNIARDLQLPVTITANVVSTKCNNNNIVSIDHALTRGDSP